LRWTGSLPPVSDAVSGIAITRSAVASAARSPALSAAPSISLVCTGAPSAAATCSAPVRSPAG